MVNLFEQQKTVIGMIHVGALPGTPQYGGSVKEIVAKAVSEANTYQAAGVHMLGIENMHDVPYLNREVGPEISATMAVVGYEVKRASGLRCGLQILAGANQSALGAAVAADLDFIRAEGYVFSHVADEGTMTADAGQLMRYRKKIEASHIPVLTDIKKKHSSHAITADVDLAETAKAAAFFLSDGLVVTGMATGTETALDDLIAVREAVDLPVLVGSGINVDNVRSYLPHVDALIVGSSFKEKGHWRGTVDGARVKALMDVVAAY